VAAWWRWWCGWMAVVVGRGVVAAARANPMAPGVLVAWVDDVPKA